VSRSQRLTFLSIAAAIAIAAVVLLVATGGDDGETARGGSQVAPTATAAEPAAPAEGETATPEPTATAEPRAPLVTSDKVTNLRFKQGETVRFRVRSDVADEVHVHGYDLMKDVEPGETVGFSFPAEITGIFEIELERAGKQIAQLRVDPD
jgi:FtsP/CotA-like multicopper oxidase with cupredoxin domain